MPLVVARRRPRLARAMRRRAWPAAAKPAAVASRRRWRPPARQRGRRRAAAGRRPAWLVAALLGALLGGLILNLMPCVFPVLAIKVVGFTQHADDARPRIAGLAYTAGVVAVLRWRWAG
jgi:thiol:disulfide interchange protein